MKKLVVFALSSVLISGCVDMPVLEQVSGGIGTVLGGIAGEKAANKMGVQDSTLRGSIIAGGAGVGAAVGIVIGQKLAQYFGKQDQQNLASVLNDTQNNQPVAWCSDKASNAPKSVAPSRNINAVECGAANKIIETPSAPVQSASGEVCRNSKTDILAKNGQYETINTKFCRTPPNGDWAEKT